MMLAPGDLVGSRELKEYIFFLPAAEILGVALSFLVGLDVFIDPLFPPFQDLHVSHLLLSSLCSVSHLTQIHTVRFGKVYLVQR